MNVAIIGDGLVSLTLAKALVNKGINVDIFLDKKKTKIDKSRTIGISKANIDFFEKNILNIKKISWNINKIEVYSENLKNEKLLNFENSNKEIFSIIKNYELYNNLITSLDNSKLFKRKKNFTYNSSKDYRLIINCDANNFITKKYFKKNLTKNYYSYPLTSIIDHKNLMNNNTAIQIFTHKGPLAFLPISNKKTSVVYSVRGSRNVDFKNLIKKYNNKYEITKVYPVANFELSSSNLRNYYFENILAFGDMLHRLHPLAGQGFNMSIRDIRLLINLIDSKLECGLELDNSICIDFEKKIKHKNYLFSNGIDFIYEFFNLESKFGNQILSKQVQFLGKNKFINKIFKNLADNGLIT